MDFDKMAVADARAQKWLDKQIEFLREYAQEEIDDGETPERRPEDIKPAMPFNVDPESEDFVGYYAFKSLAREYDLICFRTIADEVYFGLDAFPKTLQGHAAMIEHIFKEYDARMQAVAEQEPLDAVRKAWLMTESRVESMLKDSGENPWQWVQEAIKADTPFDRVGKTGGSPEMQKQIDATVEDGSLKDALMDMHGPQDNTIEVKRAVLDVLEIALKKELVPKPVWNKDKEDPDFGSKHWQYLKDRDGKLEAMQTFGDMAAAFESMKNGGK